MRKDLRLPRDAMALSARRSVGLALFAHHSFENGNEPFRLKIDAAVFFLFAVGITSDGGRRRSHITNSLLRACGTP